MAKLGTELARVQRFIKSRTKDRLDPTAALSARLELINSWIENLGTPPTRSQPEFAPMRDAVDYLLRRAERLNHFEFWDHLIFADRVPLDHVPYATRAKREEALIAAQEELANEAADGKSLRWAMGQFESVMRGMAVQFESGQVNPSDEPLSGELRYTCAAQIQKISAWLQKGWFPKPAAVLNEIEEEIRSATGQVEEE